jgi:hypothetical protein
MRGRNLLLLAVLALAGAAVLAARRGSDPRTDARLDTAIAETFPASDPIAIGHIE